MIERGGRFRAALGRVFGDAENPMGWALPLFRIAGIRVRIHLLFLVYAIGVVLFSIPRDTMGVGYTLLEMATLFLIVLLHEFGHCIAARLVGGEADDILLWPLGGLASTSPPDTWKAHLLVTLGGPAVNVLLFPLFAIALTAAGLKHAVFFNPFRIGATLATLSSWWEVALWWGHFLNLAVLAFNVLLPCFPLDGGRIVQAALWARVGRRASMEIASVVGLVGGAVLAAVGLATERASLVGVGVFCGLVCWNERRRLRAPDEIGETAYAASLREQEREREDASRRAEQARREREHEAAEVDRILAKIASTGMGSLTPREKRFLEEATARKRAGG